MVDKAVQKKSPNDPTPAQSMALGEAVAEAYKKGWSGRIGSMHTPILALSNWSYIGVPLGTRQACVRKMLAKRVKEENRVAVWPLTAVGVTAGLADFAARNDGAHPEAVFKAEAEEAAAEKAEHAARVKEAKHLWRGLKRERGSKGQKAISGVIGQGEEVKLNLDDLIAVGRGIEKLRNAGSKPKSS